MSKNVAKSKLEFVIHLVAYYMSGDMLDKLGLKKPANTGEAEELLKNVLCILQTDPDFMERIKFAWSTWSAADLTTKRSIAAKINDAIKKASEGR